MLILLESIFFPLVLEIFIQLSFMILKLSETCVCQKSALEGETGLQKHQIKTITVYGKT